MLSTDHSFSRAWTAVPAKRKGARIGGSRSPWESPSATTPADGPNDGRPSGGGDRQTETISRAPLAGGSGQVGGDDVGGVPVQGCPGPVVSHGGPRVSVGRGFLHVTQRHASIEGCGNERVPQGVRPDGLGDPGAAGDPADDPPGAVPVQPPPVRGEEDRAFARSPIARSIARAVRGASGMVTTLPPLRVMTRVRCPRSMPRRLDVRAGGLRYS